MPVATTDRWACCIPGRSGLGPDCGVKRFRTRFGPAPQVVQVPFLTVVQVGANWFEEYKNRSFDWSPDSVRSGSALSGRVGRPNHASQERE